MSNLPVSPKSVLLNPSFEDLRTLIDVQSNCRQSEFGSPNIATKVVARSKGSTFIVTDNPEDYSDQTITREELARVTALQNAHIAEMDMIVIDGFIGNDPGFRTPARLIIEQGAANIAAMQKTLYFHDGEDGDPDFEPELQVIYTPTLELEGYPDDRLIAVDLENGITRVMNSDYFGESKKGGLRMWNDLVYGRGGLSLHAGCKIIPSEGGDKVVLIVGLSGTGKTTTTFTRQNESRPVQDDFVALMPGGKVYATEAGCFAKTFGLDPEFEPAIHGATVAPTAYLENVSQDEDGNVDFFDTSYTANGRSVFPMSSISFAGDAREMKTADVLLILNRNETIIPAVAKLRPEQAAAYFMLGETKGTSAGGASEAGKSLRVPGTNPFFPGLHALQGNRLLELLTDCEMDVYLMSTGRVGGGDDVEGSKKVKIPHSSACVKGIADGTIEWTVDPDFGYEIATSVPGVSDDDLDLLQPRLLYESLGRQEEYETLVEGLKSSRSEYMAGWPGLDDRLLAAV